jgi:hypothetical protein
MKISVKAFLMEKYNLKNFLELSSKKESVSSWWRHETFDLSSSSAFFAFDRSVSRLRRQNTSRNYYTRADVGGGSKGDKVQTGTLEKSFDIAALIFEFVRHVAHRLDDIAGIDESELDLNSGQEQSQLSLFWSIDTCISGQITKPNHFKISLVIDIFSSLSQCSFRDRRTGLQRGGCVLNK